MSLREVEGRPALRGSGRCTGRSTASSSSPTRSPTTRSATRAPAAVGLPPAGRRADHPRALPAVYVIQGYTGQLDMWFTR